MPIVNDEIRHYLRPRGSRVWGIPVFTNNAPMVSNGIITLSNRKKVTQTLEVIRVGPDVKDISEGDVVIIDSDGFGEVVSLFNDENETFNAFVIKEEYIAAIVEG